MEYSKILFKSVLTSILTMTTLSFAQVTLSIENVMLNEDDTGSLEIYMTTDEVVAGFQFELVGISIESVAILDSFDINGSNETTVIALSSTGATIPPSENLLISSIIFSGYEDGNTICFGQDTGSSGNTLISDPNGVYISAEWGYCWCGSQDDSDIYFDCANECGGTSIEDCTGECGGICEICDCAGECEGTAEEDECGECGGSGPGDYCDCDGNPTGNYCDCDGNMMDDCDVCGGDGSSCMSLNNDFIPVEFDIAQNFPNPFNPVTSITFDVAEMDKISIIIYDITGNEVATIASDVYTPGRYQVEWNALNNNGEGISSGMYIYRFISSKKMITRKMLYLK